MLFTQTLLLAATAGLAASLSVDMRMVGDAPEARSADDYSNPEEYEPLHARSDIHEPEPSKAECAAAKESHDETVLIRCRQRNDRNDLETLHQRTPQDDLTPAATPTQGQCLTAIKELKAILVQEKSAEKKTSQDPEALSVFTAKNSNKLKQLQNTITQCKTSPFVGKLPTIPVIPKVLGGILPANPVGGILPANPVGGILPANPVGGILPANPVGGILPANPVGGILPANPVGGILPANPLKPQAKVPGGVLPEVAPA